MKTECKCPGAKELLARLRRRTENTTCSKFHRRRDRRRSLVVAPRSSDSPDESNRHSGQAEVPARRAQSPDRELRLVRPLAMDLTAR
jgi:hypothetical protein